MPLLLTIIVEIEFIKFGQLKLSKLLKKVNCFQSNYFLNIRKFEPLYQKEDILFRSKVYGTVLPIKHLFISESKQALLRRNLILITRENKIYSLPR